MCVHPPRECDYSFLGWGLALWLAVNGHHGDAQECHDFYLGCCAFALQ